MRPRGTVQSTGAGPQVAPPCAGMRGGGRRRVVAPRPQPRPRLRTTSCPAAATPSSSSPTGWPAGAQPLPSSLGWPSGFSDRFDLSDPGTKIGKGSYGQVFLGRDRATGEEVAVKVIPKKRTQSSSAPKLPLDSAVVLQRLQREADLLSKVSGCGNVGALRAVHESDDAAFVVLAFVDGGDLEALVTRRREEKKEEQERRQWEEEEEGKKSSTPLSPLLLSEREAAVVVFELLKALTALHSNLVLHGDIKPANIMLDASATRDALAGKWSRPFLRLADFGLGRACAAQQKVSGTRGTPVFMAPEVFRGSYGQKSDVFAAGVTLYYLLSDRYPYFETLEEVLKLSPRAVRARALGGEEAWGFDGSKEPFASWCSPSCRDLLSSLLDREEELRPTAFEALGHSWFREQLPPEPELLIREVEEQQRGRTGAGELEASSTAAFGLPSSSSSSSSAAADALSPPPLALPPGVAAVSAILAHASMSACSECEMACCPLSGTRLGGGGGGGGSGGSGGGGSGDGKSGGKSGGNGLSSAATSRLVEGAEGFLGGIDGRELTGLVHGVEPPEVDEH